MSEVLYLYGFAPEGGARPAALKGVAGRDVETLAEAGVVAVLSRVPAAEYRPDVIEERLREPAWLADQAIAHEHVVGWYVDNDDIVPAPLLTLYSGEAVLRDAVRERAPVAREQLERFRGLREWDLKVSYRADLLEKHLGEVSPEIAQLDGEIDAAAPGRKFLLRKKRADLVKTEASRGARALAESLLGELRPFARDLVRLSTQRTEGALPVALGAALLVDRDGAAKLDAAMSERRAALEERGLVPELTGPWAPYRFLGGRDGE